MICDPYRCIFIHIPKAAGISVEQFFLARLGLDWAHREPLLLRYNSDPRLGPERLAHLTASEYVDCGHVTAEVFSSYFKFSFVRNPWARLVSEYKFRNHVKRYTFKDFVFHHLPRPGPSDAYRHVLPQFDFLHAPDGRLLVDFVGRFETLQEDFDQVCARIGLDDSRLPHSNSSQHGATLRRVRLLNALFRKRDRQPLYAQYPEYYDDETRDQVTRMYQKDIDAFGYAFGR